MLERLVGFALSRALWLSLPLMLAVGFGMMVQMAASNTILQTIVDEDERGRVMSFYSRAFKARRNRPLTEEQKAFNKVVAGYRIVVEHALAQLNRFTVLRQVFRGRHQNHQKAHSQVVRVVARLVNRRTRVCPLKKYVPAA